MIRSCDVRQPPFADADEEFRAVIATPERVLGAEDRGAVMVQTNCVILTPNFPRIAIRALLSM